MKTKLFTRLMLVPSFYSLAFVPRLPELPRLETPDPQVQTVMADIGFAQPVQFKTDQHTQYILSVGQSAGNAPQSGLRIVLPVPPKPVVVVAARAIAKTPAVAPEHLEGWFNEYGQAFNVDPDKLKRIANCESHYNPGAVSSSGAYGGMYQYVASTWVSTRNAMGLDPDPNLRFDAQEAIRTTAWKISVGGIGAWPVCGKR